MKQTGLNVDFRLDRKPQRIISTVPSQTELLFDLGLEDEIAGITKFCILPEDKTKEKIKIGGTKNLNIEKIKSLKPDLIIAGKEENTKEQIDELKKDFPVWITEVDSVSSSLEMIMDISVITGTKKRGEQIVQGINDEFAKLYEYNFPVRKSLYFIWRNPYMVAAGNTFINDLMLKTRFDNVAKNMLRYPVVDEKDIKALKPDVVLLCSEPYRFGAKHITEFKNILPQAKILITDGQAFAWYGSRLLHSIKYIIELHRQLKL